MWIRKRPKIHNIGRALLVNDDRVLLLEVNDGEDAWWSFPGGHQEFGETIAESVVRECREELRCDVEIVRCLLIREFIADRLNDTAGRVAENHFFEVYFLVKAITEPILESAERYHQRSAWIEIDELPKKNAIRNI